ncbi:WD40-repeat-containing domain protein [Usnea florida]
MIFPNRRLTTLSGHSGAIHAVTYSSGTGQYILTGSSDRSVHLYNPSKTSSLTPKSGLIQSYSAHGYEVLDLAVTDDNARFASVGGDKQVFLWDVATARTLKRWSGHFGRVNCVGFGGEGCSVVVSGSYDATVRLWDCKSQITKPIQVLEEARDSVSSLHVLGHEIVTGSVDGRVRVYDLRMGMMFVDVIGQSITSVQQTRDRNGVLISTLDSTIRLMDKANGQLLQNYRGHTNKNYRIRSCLGMADSVVISGSEDGKLYAWDLLGGKVIESFEAHGGKVSSAVACNGVKKEWASAGVDGTVSIWTMPT